MSQGERYRANVERAKERRRNLIEPLVTENKMLTDSVSKLCDKLRENTEIMKKMNIQAEKLLKRTKQVTSNHKSNKL